MSKIYKDILSDEVAMHDDDSIWIINHRGEKEAVEYFDYSDVYQGENVGYLRLWMMDWNKFRLVGEDVRLSAKVTNGLLIQFYFCQQKKWQNGFRRGIRNKRIKVFIAANAIGAATAITPIISITISQPPSGKISNGPD
jgi:hypothetical protein